MTGSHQSLPDQSSAVSIAAIEYHVGIDKERLRVWERRYGFPKPLRDARGDRLYPAEQVAKLRLIKRLMDRGHQPGRLASLEFDQLFRLLAPARSEWHADTDIHAAIEMLLEGRLVEFERWLRSTLVVEGLERFVLGKGRALIEGVGNAWEIGGVAVWQEHYCSEILASVLNAAIAFGGKNSERPKILFATPPGEAHGLALLMARALFVARGTACILLGTQVPIFEIANCAVTCDIDVTAISMSAAYPAGKAAETLTLLRQNLPVRTELWAGGGAIAAALRRRRLHGVNFMRSFEEGLAAIDGWRQRNTLVR